MPMPLKLTVYKGSELVAEQAFDRDIIKIGRLASAHLKLEDTKVSRIHAVIEATSDGQGYSIIDMGSTEGTFLNGEKVSKERLRDGDELAVGDSRIVISYEDGTQDVVDGQVAASTAADPAELWAPSPQELSNAPATQVAQAASPLTQEQWAQPESPPWSGVPHQVATTSGAYPIPSVIPAAAPAPWSGAQEPYAQPAYAAEAYASYPAVGMPSGIPMGAAAYPVSPWGAWGTVPNNLASEQVPDTERALEVKTLWGNTVLETITVTTKPVVTIGDERKVKGFGPFQRAEGCDIEVPSKGLPSKTYALATSLSSEGAAYTINIPSGLEGRIDRADGSYVMLEELYRGGQGTEPGDSTGSVRYHLRPAETLYLAYEQIVFQIRYVRKTMMIAPAFFSELNYTWVNVLVLAFFLHALAIVSFVATPVTKAELTEDIFKNPNRFAQFRLTPEQKQQQASTLLSKLKEGEAGAKAKGTEGKAGKKDYKGKQGRMAVKGDPNDKEIAKSTLAKLFGGKGNVGRSYLFGSGGLGGELKGALGGVTGAEIGDATGLGGLGTRGSGPGGGGLSSNSVGLGALGTHGVGGGGGTGYGEGVGGLGKKTDRDINISAGAPLIMGSLDKEIIRRVIKQHIAQIRYCYEKELVRSPGLFGKVGTQFTISAAGTVQSAKVTESTLGNDEVGRCITAKILTWNFPKPKGGGIVIVKYPFIFKTSG